MRRKVAHAELAVDHRGDALGRPHVAQEAKGFGAIRQQGGQLGPLLSAQTGGGAGGMRTVSASVPPSRTFFSHWLTAPGVTSKARAMAAPVHPS
jgi:hypothetical protein